MNNIKALVWMQTTLSSVYAAQLGRYISNVSFYIPTF